MVEKAYLIYNHYFKDKEQLDDHGKETFMVPDSAIYIRPAFIPNQRFGKYHRNLNKSHKNANRF